MHYFLGCILAFGLKLLGLVVLCSRVLGLESPSSRVWGTKFLRLRVSGISFKGLAFKVLWGFSGSGERVSDDFWVQRFNVSGLNFVWVRAATSTEPETPGKSRNHCRVQSQAPDFRDPRCIRFQD